MYFHEKLHYQCFTGSYIGDLQNMNHGIIKKPSGLSLTRQLFDGWLELNQIVTRQFQITIIN